MGFATSLVQKNDVDESDCCTVFYTNMGIAMLAYGLIYAFAPQVAQFFQESSLEQIMRVAGLSQLIQATFTIQVILLTIRLDFRTPLIVGTGAEIIAGIISISMAYAGYQFWALVALSLSRATVKCILFHILGTWRPRLTYSVQRLKEHFGVGAKITLISSIEVAFNHFHSIVIGRAFDPLALGIFSRAKSLQTFATQNTISPLSKVIFPGLARAKNNPKRLIQIFQKSLEITAFLVFPLMTGIAFSAEAIILTLIGEKWIAAAPYLKLLCIIGAIIPIRNQCSNALKALNRLNQIIVIQAACRALSVISVLLTYRLGITAIILGEIVVTLILGISFLVATSRALNTPLRNFLKPIMPYILASVSISASLYFVPLKSIDYPFLELACSIVVGLVGYALPCYITKAPMLMELIQIARKRLRL